MPLALTHRGYIKCRLVLVQNYQEIPPRTQVDVAACVTLLSMQEPSDDAIVETCQLKPGLYVGRTLLPADRHDLKVCVANTTSEPQSVSAGTCLGQAIPVTLVDGTEELAQNMAD